MAEEPRSDVMTGPFSNGGVLTTQERLQASSLASSVVLQIASLKAPLRARVLEEIRRLLGEE